MTSLDRALQALRSVESAEKKSCADGVTGLLLRDFRADVRAALKTVEDLLTPAARVLNDGGCP